MMLSDKIARRILMVAVLCHFQRPTDGWAQTPKTVWDSHSDIREWVAVASMPAGGLPGVEDLVEDGRDFLRIRYADVSTAMVFMLPAENFGFDNLTQMATVLDPQQHNAIRLTLRMEKLNAVAGIWLHRDGSYDESMSRAPKFNPAPVPQESVWTDVTLMLSDSPFLLPTSDVVVVNFTFSNSNVTARDQVQEFRALSDLGAVLDVDRIEFVQIAGGPSFNPIVTDFTPKVGKPGVTVTIIGSGFAEPASRNVVFFGASEGEVVSGNSNQLVVRPRGFGTVSVRVLGPGGGQSVASETFRFIGEPRQVIVVSGADQNAPVGTTLAPIVIKVADLSDNGVPGVSASFRIKSGSGTLSVEQAVTDDDGLVSTVLTLGPSAGPVTLEYSVQGFKPRTLSATATP